MRILPSLSASLLLTALALPAATAANANIVITVDKTTQHMSVAVDGVSRYEWPVSTGRPGYDTPSGTYKPNRMDADHFSQEWDNAPMPHTVFFDLHGHAIHGFFDVKHLGLAVSHGCVRLAPPNATVLFDLIKSQGMANTSVVVEGQTPHAGPAMAQQSAPVIRASAPQPIAPGYGQRPVPPGYAQPSYGQPVYAQRYYGQPAYGQSYYGQPTYGPRY